LGYQYRSSKVIVQSIFTSQESLLANYMPSNPDKSNCLFIFPRPVPANETDVSNSSQIRSNPVFPGKVSILLIKLRQKKGASAKNLTDAPFYRFPLNG
jgi:hypothetical protein